MEQLIPSISFKSPFTLITKIRFPNSHHILINIIHQTLNHIADHVVHSQTNSFDIFIKPNGYSFKYFIYAIKDSPFFIISSHSHHNQHICANLFISFKHILALNKDIQLLSPGLY